MVSGMVWLDNRPRKILCFIESSALQSYSICGYTPALSIRITLTGNHMREKYTNKALDKKFHNVCARFFGIENMKDKEILIFMEKIKKLLTDELFKIDTRVRKIEKRVFKTGKHFNKDGIEVSRNYKHQCNDKCE